MCSASTITIALILLLAEGCGGILEPGPESGRRHSQQSYYTSDLHHEKYLTEDMQLMDRSVKALQSLAADESVGVSERLARVLRELDTLQATARIIKSGQEIFSYTSVSPYMGSFQYDLSIAREHAQRTPPDFQPAAWLVKSCLFCHDNI